MFDIGKYLEKFKVMSQSREFLRKTVAETIKEVCNIDVDLDKIEVKNFIARVGERSIIKTEIFLKKNKIVEKLKTKTNNKITDIL